MQVEQATRAGQAQRVRGETQATRALLATLASQAREVHQALDDVLPLR